MMKRLILFELPEKEPIVAMVAAEALSQVRASPLIKTVVKTVVKTVIKTVVKTMIRIIANMMKHLAEEDVTKNMILTAQQIN